jgi:regulation of enolase protein 1 (concanavalin A-like superfamily)
MKKLFLLFITFLLIQLTTLAQAPDTLWTKTFGGINAEKGNCVQQTTDGGFVIVGSTNSFGAGEDDIWIIKTNVNGDTIWTKTYGGNTGEEGYSVQQTNDGGYIIVGYTDSFGSGEDDVWLIKTDENGDSLWAKTFGGSGDEGGFSVEQTDDGGYIIAGYTTSFGAGEEDVWLIKTDANGDTLWTQTFGGSWYDCAHSVQQTTDGGYIIAGEIGIIPKSGAPAVWLIKTDTSGDTLWNKILFIISSAHSVQQTTDGGYIITGYKGAIDSDVWLIKTDENGDTLWTKTFGGILWDDGYSVQQTTDGGFILTGRTQSFGAGEEDVLLIKTAPDPSYINQDIDIIPLDFSLHQNYPNPFNPITKIRYSIPQASNVVIKVFDILGNEIETLLDEEKPVGTYELSWCAESLPSGVYFYQLIAGDYIQTRKMILIK